MKNVVGIDLSYTATGIIWLRDGEILRQKVIKFPKLKGWERIDNITYDIDRLLHDARPDLICIEGYSFGSTFGMGVTIGELGGIVRYNSLYSEDYKYIDVAPTQLKKFATGKGIGKKELIMMKVLKEYGIEFEDNNLCDAFVLAKIADALVRSVKLKNKAQQEIIEKLKKEKM